MQQISDWNILRDQAHEMAKRHGFWDETPSDNHFLCLIVSELMEAVEADRKDRRGNLKEMVEIVDNQEKSEFWYRALFAFPK